MTKDVVKMIFYMDNAVEAEYPEIRSAASKALHSGEIVGFAVNRPSKKKQERQAKRDKK